MDLMSANRHGQQLFLANLRHSTAGQRNGYRRPRRGSSPETFKEPLPFVPVPYRQLVLFDSERDLRRGQTHGFSAPARPEMAAALDSVLLEIAPRHGWSHATVKTTRRGISIVLSLQDTPGAPVRATEVLRLHQLTMNCTRVLQVCQVAGLLEDDREPPLERWFAKNTSGLPEQMRSELGHWYTVMKSGSRTPPRSRPRAKETLRLYLRSSLPALRSWAAAGHSSLREITPCDLPDVLPPSGDARALMGQGLRCIFRILKAHGVVFLNPMNGIRTGTAQSRPPMPLPPAVLKDALHAPDPARAALTSLAAFYGLRTAQLRHLLLTDLHSGSLHLDTRTIPLAAPVRDRIAAWLAHRELRWPRTANQHLFINRSTALGTGPVSIPWVNQSIGMRPQEIREDRILHELIASRGDLRRICDMFGLSIRGARRYATALGHPGLSGY
jgi:hypothetical protein